MKNILFLFILCLIPLNSLNSALPPLYQGMKEIKAIFDEPDLLKHLNSGDMIMEIKKTENGYLIVTNKKQVPVDIVYESSNVPGPVRFHIRFPVKTSNNH